MLDSLLVTLGSAAIGGALVYFLWSVVTRRLAAFHAARAKRRAATHAAPPPAGGSAAVAGGDDGVPEIDGLAEIRDSIVDLARAQVSIIERLDDTADADPRGEGEDEQDAVTGRLDEMAATLRALAERTGPEAALADGMGALDGRLATIEDKLETLGPPEDAADRDAAMAEAVEALANRLEGVESGLVRVLGQVEAASASDPDPEAQAAALRAVIEEALPVDALPALETRLNDRLASLSERIETTGSMRDSDMMAGLTEMLDQIEAQLRAAADETAMGRQSFDALAEQVSSVQRQLDAPAEVGFSEETLAELQARLRAVLDDGSDPGQHAALAELLQALDTRLDAVQTRLDALASDRSAGRTLELIGAISTLQSDTALLKGGIERTIAEIGDSGERVSALDSRIAALETAITGPDGSAGAEAVEALVRRLEDMTKADLPTSLAEALKAELPSLAGSVAGMLDERLEQRSDPWDTTARPRAEEPAVAPAAAPEAQDTDLDDPTGDAALPGPSAGPAELSPMPNSAVPGAERPTPAALAGRARSAAEAAHGEAALLRARPGLATVIGRHASEKYSAGDS